MTLRLARRATGLIVLVAAFGLFPAAALAAGPLGSLSQLASPNNCIESLRQGATADCGTPSTANLNEAQDVVVSPDGKNVYMLELGSVSEFARRADGSLAELAAANDCIGTNAGCVTAVGTNFPSALAISPDGNSVYVVGTQANNIGNIAEFARHADGSLTQLTGANNCISETVAGVSTGCGTMTGRGLTFPSGVVVSPDGANVYVTDRNGNAIAEFARHADGSLAQLAGQNNCIQEHGASTPDCGTTSGTGLSNATSVAISGDGANVYVGAGDSIAEFARNPGGSLTQLASPNDCVENHTASTPDCASHAGIGISEIVSLAVSPDGHNLYSASINAGGAIAEFARNANGSLSQLGGANSCIEENATGEGGPPPVGCGTQTGHGLDESGAIKVSPDGANVYVASFSDDGGRHDAVAEFARTAGGALTQLASPNDCIEEHGAFTPDCGNENGHGVGTGFGAIGLAISPDAANVYTTGSLTGGDIAEFARALPTLTVSLAGAGGGTVSDGTGAIACSPTCSHAYPVGQVVTLTASPRSGSGFVSWSGGGCSGASTCQVTMNADTAVTATFAIQTPPTPVSTGTPPSIGGTTAAFTGSVNPGGLPTTAFFQYGLDPKYTGGGPITYTQSTPVQAVGSDFTIHTVTASVTGLVPNATYHVRLVATNAAGTSFGPDIVFNTLKTAPPPPPTLGNTFNISLVNGVVLIKINGVFIPLTELQQIPKNTVINALHGTLSITTAVPGGPGGAHDAAAKGKKKKVKTQSGTFGGAVFKLTQAHSGLATLALVENAFKGAPSYATCKKPKAADATAAALSAKTLQLLHANAKGKFRTSGKYSAATVRGTKWTIADRCDGTLTHDIFHSVAVTDFVRHKTIILHAGQSYLAKPRK